MVGGPYGDRPVVDHRLVQHLLLLNHVVILWKSEGLVRNVVVVLVNRGSKRKRWSRRCWWRRRTGRGRRRRRT